MGILTGLFHSRDKPKNSLRSALSFLFGGTTSGKTANEHTARPECLSFEATQEVIHKR